MGLVDKPAFTAGELDPSLWERTNLDKYRNGLAAARNWIISKTGSILTRAGRNQVVQTKLLNRGVILYSPPGGGVVLEWGHLYVRIYNISTFALIADLAQPYLASDIGNLHFDTSGSFVYIFCTGKNILKLNYATHTFVDPSSIFAVPQASSSGAVTPSGAPSGYKVEYAVTYLVKGEESLPFYIPSNFNVPIAAGELNVVTAIIGPAAPGTNPNPYITQVNVYRRPNNGGAYGFIGSGSSFNITGGVIYGYLTDLGQSADYTHQPPSSLMPNDPNTAPPNTQVPFVPVDPGTLLSNTGIVYQQRLLITDSQTDLEAIYASQPGFQDNFYRNYPLDAASALKFKAGTSGYARVLRMLDSDGLVAFTAAGIFLNQGSLTPDNITLQKKGKWIINESVPPLAVPGGTMFIDAATNGVRNLLWSFQLNAFDAEEVSIYSNHLFRTRLIVTWNFQQGVFPLLWVVFADSTYASFTYDYNQQMQAWTRHDSNEVLTVHSSCGTTIPDLTFFVVSTTDGLGNVTRYIEATNPRYTPPIDIATDPDFDKNPACAYMDSITTARSLLNRSLLGSDVFLFGTSVPGDWTQPLLLSCGTSGIFTDPGPGTVGGILRFFDDDGSAIDFQITARTDNNTITVIMVNTDAFDPEWITGRQIYLTLTQVTGLGYMEGENPAVIVDGAVVCSPNNDVDNYPVATVTLGVLTLPNNLRGAIIHVGRPITGDLQTLDIDTVEQAPTLIESITVNKVYVKVKDAKSLFIGPQFPVDSNGVQGMESIDNFPVDYTQVNPIIGNRAQPPQTRRFEVTLQGDYRSQGKLCVRQVDPLHAEILSFIPDVEVLTRRDK